MTLSILNWSYRLRQKKLTRHLKVCGTGVSLSLPLRISGAENISIYDDTCIAPFGWIAAVPLTGEKECQLVINKGCSIGRFCHLFATSSIVIEENVLIAERVYISDNLHSYEDINTPIMSQGVVQKQKVKLGAGCWIGENVSIVGASVGKQSVIGANSVVTHSIPDYCVAVGVPARVIKRYDFTKKEWINV